MHHRRQTVISQLSHASTPFHMTAVCRMLQLGLSQRTWSPETLRRRKAQARLPKMVSASMSGERPDAMGKVHGAGLYKCTLHRQQQEEHPTEDPPASRNPTVCKNLLPLLRSLLLFPLLLFLLSSLLVLSCQLLLSLLLILLLRLLLLLLLLLLRLLPLLFCLLVPKKCQPACVSRSSRNFRLQSSGCNRLQRSFCQETVTYYFAWSPSRGYDTWFRYKAKNIRCNKMLQIRSSFRQLEKTAA